MADELTIDIYAGLDHRDDTVDVSPVWAPEEDRRRLNFYFRVASYIETKAREGLAESADDPDRKTEWREYGDASVVVDRIASAVVGDNVTILVDGADDPLPNRPELEPAPLRLPDPDEADPAVVSVLDAEFVAVLAVWSATAAETIESWASRLSTVPVLQERQRWLRRWADGAQFFARVFENETENVVPFGDGVYVLGWDPDGGRVEVNIYEPDAYFPDLNTADPGKYPTTVRLAWGFTELVDGEEVEKVRIIRYDLVPLADVEGAPVSFPYRSADAPPATEVCVMTDGVWLAADLESLLDPGPPEAFSQVAVPGGAGETVPLDSYPTGLDFIPVVHTPNTLSSARHFGRSSIGRLGQLFDEIAMNDTEESRAARWAGRPPLAISGFVGTVDSVDMSPGSAIKLPAGGRLDQVDMASNLEKLGDRGAELLKRLSVNGKVPAGLLGRVDASEVPSGLALTLSFTPFTQLVNALRMARLRKHRLLLAMVQRIAIANGDETISDDVVYPAELRFGSFMPQDLPGAADIIGRLLNANALSTTTAVLMGQAAGIPVDDVEAEVEAIHARDAETAESITMATGDPKHGAQALGIRDYVRPTGPDTEAPVPVLPGALIAPPGAAE